MARDLALILLPFDENASNQIIRALARLLSFSLCSGPSSLLIIVRSRECTASLCHGPRFLDILLKIWNHDSRQHTNKDFSRLSAEEIFSSQFTICQLVAKGFFEISRNLHAISDIIVTCRYTTKSHSHPQPSQPILTSTTSTSLLPINSQTNHVLDGLLVSSFKKHSIPTTTLPHKSQRPILSHLWPSNLFSTRESLKQQLNIFTCKVLFRTMSTL
jgi:hypothetical protein